MLVRLTFLNCTNYAILLSNAILFIFDIHSNSSDSSGLIKVRQRFDRGSAKVLQETWKFFFRKYDIIPPKA